LKEFIKKINFATTVQLVLSVVIVIFPVITLITIPHMAVAQNNVALPPCPEGVGLNCGVDDVNSLFVTVINWAMAIAFMAAVIFLIYGGYRYIFAGGNEESAKAGRQAIFNSLIGLIIIVMSYVIVQIVYKFFSGQGTGLGIGN
jgi:hypothetical protein